MLNKMWKIPNLKHQIANKFQAPSTKFKTKNISFFDQTFFVKESLLVKLSFLKKGLRG